MDPGDDPGPNSGSGSGGNPLSMDSTTTWQGATSIVENIEVTDIPVVVGRVDPVSAPASIDTDSCTEVSVVGLGGRPHSTNSKGGVEPASTPGEPEVCADLLKRGREPTSSDKKPRKRRNEDQLSSGDELDDGILPPVSLLDSSDNEGTDKQSVQSAGLSENIRGLAVGEPMKRTRMRKRGKYADAAKKSFRLWVTKDGVEYKDLEHEEFKKVRNALDDLICEGLDTIGFLPKISFITRASSGKTIIACDDQRTVDFVKEWIKAYASGYGAWGQNEGPNLKAYVVIVPHPTARRPVGKILDIIKRNNELKGAMVLLNTIRFDTGVNIMVGIDQVMEESLKCIDFQPYCGIFRLKLVPKAERDAAKNVVPNEDGNERTADMGSKEGEDSKESG